MQLMSQLDPLFEKIAGWCCKAEKCRDTLAALLDMALSHIEQLLGESPSWLRHRILIPFRTTEVSRMLYLINGLRLHLYLVYVTLSRHIIVTTRTLFVV